LYNYERQNKPGAGLHFTGRSPGFSITFKCPAEHLNEQGL